jgi:hypothetical protein
MGSWKTILTYHPRSSSHNTADYVAWMREVAKLNPKLINITEVPTRTYSSKTRNFRVAIIEAYKSWDIEWPTDSALGSTTDPKEQQLVWCCQPGGGWHERGSGLRPEKWAESRGVK